MKGGKGGGGADGRAGKGKGNKKRGGGRRGGKKSATEEEEDRSGPVLCTGYLAPDENLCTTGAPLTMLRFGSFKADAVVHIAAVGEHVAFTLSSGCCARLSKHAGAATLESTSLEGCTGWKGIAALQSEVAPAAPILTPASISSPTLALALVSSPSPSPYLEVVLVSDSGELYSWALGSDAGIVCHDASERMQLQGDESAMIRAKPSVPHALL